MEVVEGRGYQKVQTYLESFPDPDRVKAVASGHEIVKLRAI